MRENDLVGPVEIAERLGVQRTTVHQWRWRGRLPEPFAVVSGMPVWKWETIRRWAIETGRLPR